MKVNITINDELLKRADNYAKENYMTRSGLVSSCLNQYLNAAELTAAIKSMTVAMRQIAEIGNVSEEQMNKLKEFEVLSKLLSEGKSMM